MAELDADGKQHVSPETKKDGHVRLVAIGVTSASAVAGKAERKKQNQEVNDDGMGTR